MQIILTKPEVIEILCKKTLMAEKRSLLLYKFDREDLNILSQKDIKSMFRCELESMNLGAILDTGLWDLIFVDCPVIVGDGLKGELL